MKKYIHKKLNNISNENADHANKTKQKQIQDDIQKQLSNSQINSVAIIYHCPILIGIAKSKSTKVSSVTMQKALEKIEQPKIQHKTSESQKINNFQDQLLFKRVQKSKSLVFHAFLNKTNEQEKIKPIKKFSFSEKRKHQNDSQVGLQNSYNKIKQEIKLNKNYQPKIKKIEDIIDKNKNRLKLPSFVRNLQYLEKNRQLQDQNTLIDNKFNVSQIHKRTISLIHEKKPRLGSKISDNFYRISSNSKQNRKNKKVVEKCKLKIKTQNQNQAIEDYLQKMQMHQSEKVNSQNALLFKNWKNPELQFETKKIILTKKHSLSNKKNLMNLSENSIKIKCAKYVNRQECIKTTNKSLQKVHIKIKLNTIQKLPKIQRFKAQPQNVQDTQILRRYKSSMRVQKQVTEYTDDIKNKLKMRLQQLNETNCDTWNNI